MNDIENHDCNLNWCLTDRHIHHVLYQWFYDPILKLIGKPLSALWLNHSQPVTLTHSLRSIYVGRPAWNQACWYNSLGHSPHAISILLAQWPMVTSVLTMNWQSNLSRVTPHLIDESLSSKVWSHQWKSWSKLFILDTFRYENTTKIYRHSLQKSLHPMSEIVDGL